MLFPETIYCCGITRFDHVDFFTTLGIVTAQVSRIFQDFVYSGVQWSPTIPMGIIITGVESTLESTLSMLKKNQIKLLLHFCTCLVVLENIWSTHVPIYRCFKDPVTIKSENCIKGFCINRIRSLDY